MTRKFRGALLLWGLAIAGACSESKTVSLLGGQARTVTDSGRADTNVIPPTPGCTTSSECQPPTGQCHVETGECVQCLRNEDCSTQVCNSVTHACTGCLTNSDCDPATPICDRDDRKCVECDSASQCPNGEVCAFAAHRCAPACQTSADCAGSGHPICAPASRVCVECTSDAECVSLSLAPHCDLRLGACVECLADGDCATTHCEPLEHFCVECTSDADCSGKVCDKYICR